MVKAFLPQNPGVTQEMPLSHSQDPKVPWGQAIKGSGKELERGTKTDEVGTGSCQAQFRKSVRGTRGRGVCQRRRRRRQTGDCLKVNWQQRMGDGGAWGRGWWAEEGRGGRGFEGALCRGSPSR